MGVCNADGCKIPVPSPWNADLFEELLQGYHDAEIMKFIRYGWPLEVNMIESAKLSLPNNQVGVHNNPKKLDQYLSEELNRGSVIGPFKFNPLGP